MLGEMIYPRKLLIFRDIYAVKPDLFDNIDLPDAHRVMRYTGEYIDVPSPDKDTLIGTIMMQCADHIPVFTDPVLCKKYVEVFFKSHKYMFSKLWDSTFFDLDPMVNYDIKETHEGTFNADSTVNENMDTTGNSSTTATGKRTSNTTGSTNQTSDSTGTNEITRNQSENMDDHITETGETIHAISAYNLDNEQGFSNQWQDKTDRNQNETRQGTVNETKNETQHDVETIDKKDTSETIQGSTDNTTGETSGNTQREGTGNNTGTDAYVNHRYGFTPYQGFSQMDMLKEYRELAMFNWYKTVCDFFEHEFCVSIL